jgi:hypothetical protein
MTNRDSPVFSYGVCLECGRKTLTYSNSLCRDCILFMKVRAIVMAHINLNRNPFIKVYKRVIGDMR